MKTTLFIILLGIICSGQGLSRVDIPGEQLGKQKGQNTGWNGTFSGSINGVASTLIVKASETTLEGTIDAGGYIYKMNGRLEGNQSQGKFNDPNTGGSMDYTATLSGNVISIRVIVPGQFGQTEQLQLVFKREGVNEVQIQSPGAITGNADKSVERDQRIIGGWRHTTSYTSGDFSAVSEWYMQINADGTYRYGDGQMLGGNSDVNFDSGQGSANTGKWKTENNIVYINQGNGWQPYAYYTVDSSSMLFKFNDGSKQLWERYQ